MPIYRSKIKCLVATFIFTFCTIFLFVYGISNWKTGIGWILLLFFFLFLLGTIDFLKQSLSSKPLIYFSEEGLQDYSQPFLSGKCIRWTDCQEARLSSRQSAMTFLEFFDGSKRIGKVNITFAAIASKECLQIANDYLLKYGKNR